MDGPNVPVLTPAPLLEENEIVPVLRLEIRLWFASLAVSVTIMGEPDVRVPEETVSVELLRSIDPGLV
jgi:hypothetical protein